MEQAISFAVEPLDAAPAFCLPHKVLEIEQGGFGDMQVV
jgi:hypothetical protein